MIINYYNTVINKTRNARIFEEVSNSCIAIYLLVYNLKNICKFIEFEKSSPNKKLNQRYKNVVMLKVKRQKEL